MSARARVLLVCGFMIDSKHGADKLSMPMSKSQYMYNMPPPVVMAGYGRQSSGTFMRANSTTFQNVRHNGGATVAPTSDYGSRTAMHYHVKRPSQLQLPLRQQQREYSCECACVL